MKTSKLIFPHALTHLRVGNFIDSNNCWAARNSRSFSCALSNWPQTDMINTGGSGEHENPCKGNRNEIMLMECLNKSGEDNWWQSFAGCTSADQCIKAAKNK